MLDTVKPQVIGYNGCRLGLAAEKRVVPPACLHLHWDMTTRDGGSMAHEEWRDVVGYEGLYQVSSTGRVKTIERTREDSKRKYRVPEKLLSLPHNAYGYPVVSLHRDGKQKTVPVHRLVAIAFLPNPTGKICVDHINGKRDDNRVENLRWVTHKENSQHMFELGTNVKWSERNMDIETRTHFTQSQQIAVVRSDGVVFDSIISAAKSIGYKSSKMITENLKGRVKSVRGFTFSYLDNTD